MSYSRKGLRKPRHPKKPKGKKKLLVKKGKPIIAPKAREVDINKLIQLNEEMASCLEKGDWDGAEKIDDTLIKLVGTNDRVVINRVVAPPRPMYMYAFNRAMLRMNRGYVQEAAICMIDVMETLFFGGVQEDIYFVFDVMAEQRGKHDQFRDTFELACDYLLMAIMCLIRFPAMSLSFFWKAKVLFGKVGRGDLERFTLSFIRDQYEVLAAKCAKDDPLGAELFKEAASKIQVQCEVPSRESIETTIKELAKQREKEILKAKEEQAQREEYEKDLEHKIKTYEDAKNINALRPDFDTNDSMLLKKCGALDKDAENLPNILEVLDLVCYDEERYAVYYDKTCKLIYVSGQAHEREGKIDMVVNTEGKYVFLPEGVVKNMYYRGQTNFKLPCKPSLYRNLTEKQIFVERLKLCEFSLLLHKHPSANLFRNGLVNKLGNGSLEQHELSIDDEALAQHYGIKTNYLDLTVDKWVAAFFACCDYKVSPAGERDSYVKHTGNDVGVFYVYQGAPDYSPDGAFRPVGMQPQSRPVLQSGYVRRMEKDEDFNDMATAIPFRYHSGCTSILFWLFDQSLRIMPMEVIETKAKRIVAEEQTFSDAAFELAHKRYYRDLDEEGFMTKIEEYGLHRQAEPLVDFTPEERHQTLLDRRFWEQYLWNNAHAEQIIMIPVEA